MSLLSGKKESNIQDEKSTIRQIPLAMLARDENQPRRKFTGIEELAESIKTTQGIQMPLHVLKINEEKYQVITGERRYQAAKYLVSQKNEWSILGESVPCIVHPLGELDNASILRLQLIENLQREDLFAIEEARAYQRLIDQGETQRKIAKELGRSESLISGCLAILKLPEKYLSILDTMDTPPSKRELIKIAQEKDESKREEMLKALLGEVEAVETKTQQEPIPVEEKPSEEKSPQISSDELWELLKKLVKKDKENLLKLFSTARIRKLKDMLEKEE